MRHLLKTLTFVILLVPFTSSAQHWTEEEQELIDHIIMDWNAWMEAIEKNDIEIWLTKSPRVENAKWWWTEEGAPSDAEWVRRNWDMVRRVDAGWSDMRPVSILIHGNAGIVHFYGYWKANTKDGPVVTEAKRTEL